MVTISHSTPPPPVNPLSLYFKCLLLLVVGLLLALLHQGKSDMFVSMISSFTVPTEDFSDRGEEQRVPLRPDEFWVTDSDNVTLPFELDYVPPDETWGKVEPMWNCTTRNRSKKLVFVHVVRSEAMVVQDLLSSYASACHAGFMSVGRYQSE